MLSPEFERKTAISRDLEGRNVLVPIGFCLFYKAFWLVDIMEHKMYYIDIFIIPLKAFNSPSL